MLCFRELKPNTRAHHTHFNQQLNTHKKNTPKKQKQSNGNLGAYWRTLSDAGISRERLASFDRAITTDPAFFADKRDALVREFRNYLTILQASASGC